MGRHRTLDAHSDSDSDADLDPHTLAAYTLTSAKAAELCPKPYRLVARSRSLHLLDDISSLRNLDYVDLCHNQLRHLAPLATLPRLKTLLLANNRISDLTPLLPCHTLRILNISHNPLSSLDILPHASFAPNLLTLVATDIALADATPLASLVALHVAVLSSNELTDISPLAKLAQLEKLSLSGNQIRDIPVELTRARALKELRLARNRIRALPQGPWPTLAILDIGHNHLRDVNALTGMDRLKNVNLKHNPLDVALLPAVHDDAQEDNDDDGKDKGREKKHSAKKRKLKKLDKISSPHSESVNSGAQSPPKDDDDKEKGDDKVEKSDVDIALMRQVHAFIQTNCPGVDIVDGQRLGGGRRKIRLNRLRRAAGLQAQTDGRAVRVPHALYVRKVVGQKGEGVDGKVVPKEAARELEREEKLQRRRARKARKAEAKEKGNAYEREGKDVETEVDDAAQTEKPTDGEQEAEADDDANSGQDNMANLGRKLKRKRARDDADPADDETVLSAEEFVRQARAKHGAARLQDGKDGSVVRKGVKVKAGDLEVKNGKAKKAKRMKKKAAQTAQPFGGGGESQW